MGTKYSQLMSEKLMTASVGCVLHMLRLFFFFSKSIVGFQLVSGKSLREIEKTQKAGMSRKTPRV